jgi:hypothetical protein
MSDRLWPMHFETMPTPRPRTLKQSATAITTKTKAKGRALSLKRWHQRLGHLNHADVKQLATYSSQIKLANNKKLFCEPCTYGKQYAIPNHEPQPRAETIFDLIHVDLGGGKKSLSKANSRILTFDDDIPPTPKGAKYFMIITDNYSRYRWFFAFKRKSDAKKVLKDWIIMIQTQFHKIPKRIRTDCGKEWLNKILSKFVTKKGIQ